MTTAKPLLDLGYGSGQPAGMPDFKPRNPWGRAMPKPARPIRHQPVDAQLCQVVVEHGGHLKPVGPRAPREMLEPLLIAINREIGAGKELAWSDPQIVEVKPALAA